MDSTSGCAAGAGMPSVLARSANAAWGSAIAPSSPQPDAPGQAGQAVRRGTAHDVAAGDDAAAKVGDAERGGAVAVAMRRIPAYVRARLRARGVDGGPARCRRDLKTVRRKAGGNDVVHG